VSTLAIVLIVVLILVLAGGWGGRASYGASPYYGPGIGLVGLVIVILLVLVLLGAIRI
jgi:Protein of unknown function (DUF3309)